jgi:hypothetical protein
MTNTEIKEILDTRGYILECDCADAPTLSSRQIEDYTGKDTSAIAEEVQNSGWLYALYNTNKFSRDEIANRIKYKQAVAKYLCDLAKSGDTVHYRDFNGFLNGMELDYFDMTDIRFLIEEICRDFKSITQGHILSAVLVTNDGISSSGFWNLVDVKRRLETQCKEDFHKNELDQLKITLANYDCGF